VKVGDFSDFQKTELSLWVIVIVLLLILAYYFINRGIHKEDIPKSFNIAAGIIFLGVGYMRICSILYDYFDILYENQIILFLGNIGVFLGALPLVLYLEKNTYRRTKYLLSIVAIVFFSVFIFVSLASNFDKMVMGFWVLPPFAIELLILAGGYIYLIIKSSGTVRKSSLLILIGVALLLGFWYIHGTYGPHGIPPIPIVADYLAILSPLFIIIGTLIAAKGFFGYS